MIHLSQETLTKEIEKDVGINIKQFLNLSPRKKQNFEKIEKKINIDDSDIDGDFGEDYKVDSKNEMINNNINNNIKNNINNSNDINNNVNNNNDDEELFNEVKIIKSNKKHDKKIENIHKSIKNLNNKNINKNIKIII